MNKNFRFSCLIFATILVLRASTSQVQTSNQTVTTQFITQVVVGDVETPTTRQDLFPVSFGEAWGFVLIIFITGLANAGGLGGGPLLSPILIMIFNYSESDAIEMVYALVFGGSIGNFLNVVRQKDPKTHKPLIDYNLAMVCMPLMLLGANLGVELDRMSAPLITLVGILSVIFYSLTKLYQKTRKTYAEETLQKKSSVLLSKVSDSVNSSFLSLASTDQDTIDPKLESVLKSERRLFPKKKIAMIVTLILAIMLLAFLRGTKKFESIVGASYCGPEYWSFLGLLILLCLLVLFINLKLIKKPLKVKAAFGIRTDKNRFELSKEHINKLLALSLIAGVLAGLLGIGGGMIMSPTLVYMGVPARTLAATTGFFVLQTSFISVFQSILYRDVPIMDQGFFFLISIIGSYGVSFVLSWLVRKYNRPSLVLMALMMILALSLVTTPVFVILKNASNFSAMIEFGSFC